MWTMATYKAIYWKWSVDSHCWWFESGTMVFCPVLCTSSRAFFLNDSAVFLWYHPYVSRLSSHKKFIRFSTNNSFRYQFGMKKKMQMIILFQIRKYFSSPITNCNYSTVCCIRSLVEMFGTWNLHEMRADVWYPFQKNYLNSCWVSIKHTLSLACIGFKWIE